jgi:hypothetical protein
MTSKATQEYRLSFIALISHLSEFEQKGQEFFDKMQFHDELIIEEVIDEKEVKKEP